MSRSSMWYLRRPGRLTCGLHRCHLQRGNARMYSLCRPVAHHLGDRPRNERRAPGNIIESSAVREKKARGENKRHLDGSDNPEAWRKNKEQQDSNGICKIIATNSACETLLSSAVRARGPERPLGLFADAELV